VQAEAPRIFSPDYYRKLDWVEQQHPWSAHMQRLALRLLDRFGGGSMTRVLDAGCGAGYFTLLWREQSRPRVAVGIDSALPGLELGRSRGLRDMAAGSVDALAFRGGVFDAIYCADVLQHLTDDSSRRTIAEFARVLRQGGLLVVRTAARRGIGAKKHRDAADYQQWEPEKLRERLVSAGFLVEWISLVNWLPSLAADLRAYGRAAPVGDVGLQVSAAPPTGVGRLVLGTYWAFERTALLKLGIRLPGGHTLMCVARKA
jgi:SAM-dependent methyltransferase